MVPHHLKKLLDKITFA